MTPVICLLLVTHSAGLARDANAPAKLSLAVGSRSVQQGRPLSFTVSLLNKENGPAAAVQDTVVDIGVRTTPKDAVQLTQVTVRKGQSSASGRVGGIPISGVVYLWAKSPNLLAGGVNVKVKGAVPLTVMSAPAARGLRVARLPIAAAARAPAAVERAGAPPVTAQPPPAPPPPAPEETAEPVMLSFAPQRDFWANGKDPVTLSAFYVGPGAGAASEIRLRFADGTGTMKPNPLVIRQGSDEGSSVLTFDRVGPVDVKFVRADPRVDLRGDAGFHLRFVPPPGTKLALSASPPVITLAQTAKLVVEILDDSRTPIATAEDRTVTLKIKSGQGSLDRMEVKIPATKSSGEAEFSPVWRGETTITASAPGFEGAETSPPIKVTLPVALMVISAISGLLGGLLASFPKKRKKKWWNEQQVHIRLATGLLTGFFLYWAASLGLVSFLSRGLLLNPISAAVLALLGGWLGTGVFSLVLKGSGKAAAQES